MFFPCFICDCHSASIDSMTKHAFSHGYKQNWPLCGVPCAQSTKARKSWVTSNWSPKGQTILVHHSRHRMVLSWPRRTLVWTWTYRPPVPVAWKMWWDPPVLFWWTEFITMVLPSWEVTYHHLMMALLKMMFLFPRWDMCSFEGTHPPSHHNTLSALWPGGWKYTSSGLTCWPS